MNSKSIETSVIADDATITGNVDFVGTLIVEGKMEGEIKGADMTVQKTGKINGTLKVGALNCHGEIEGDIKAEQIIAHSSAVLTGEIQANTIEMAPGARLNGQVTMTTDSPQTQPSKAASNKHANPLSGATKNKLEPSAAVGSNNIRGKNTHGKNSAGKSNKGKPNKGKASKLSDLVLD